MGTAVIKAKKMVLPYPGLLISMDSFSPPSDIYCSRYTNKETNEDRGTRFTHLTKRQDVKDAEDTTKEMQSKRRGHVG